MVLRDLHEGEHPVHGHVTLYSQPSPVPEDKNRHGKLADNRSARVRFHRVWGDEFLLSARIIHSPRNEDNQPTRFPSFCHAWAQATTPQQAVPLAHMPCRSVTHNPGCHAHVCVGIGTPIPGRPHCSVGAATRLALLAYLSVLRQHCPQYLRNRYSLTADWSIPTPCGVSNANKMCRQSSRPRVGRSAVPDVGRGLAHDLPAPTPRPARPTEPRRASLPRRRPFPHHPTTTVGSWTSSCATSKGCWTTHRQRVATRTPPTIASCPDSIHLTSVIRRPGTYRANLARSAKTPRSAELRYRY